MLLKFGRHENDTWQTVIFTIIIEGNAELFITMVSCQAFLFDSYHLEHLYTNLDY